MLISLHYDDETKPDDCELLSTVRTVYSYHGLPAKAPGELVICADRFTFVVYDLQGAVANLRRQGVPGPDAARIARIEADWLSGWYADRWIYVGVEVSIPGTDCGGSLWGEEYAYGPTESLDCLPDLLSECLDQFRAHVAACHAAGAFPA